MRVYTPVVAQESHADTDGGGVPRSNPVRRRRSPSAAEQKRREQWGKEWGAVGAAHKRKRQAEGK